MARILVVEDDGALRTDIAHTVADWGHDVLVACDGRQGFKAINEWQPDLVLSDINMPNEDGMALVNRVAKAGSRYGDMAFIFVSSRSGSELMTAGIQCGADDYVTKPIDYALLQAKISAHLRKRDNLLSKVMTEQLADTVAGSMFNGLMFTAVAGAIGFVVLFVLYWIKTVLGINIFADFHMSDLF